MVNNVKKKRSLLATAIIMERYLVSKQVFLLVVFHQPYSFVLFGGSASKLFRLI